MNLSKEAVEKIAHLARLEFDEAALKDMQQSLERVLDWMEALNAVDTHGVEPLIHVSPVKNGFRADEAKQELTRKQALANGPDVNETYFKVPQVLD